MAKRDSDMKTITAEKKVTSSGTSLIITATKEIKNIGLKEGDKVKVTFENVEYDDENASEYMAKSMWCELYDMPFYDPESIGEKNEIRDMTRADRELLRKFIAGNFMPELEEHIKPHIEEWSPSKIVMAIKKEID